MADPRSGRLVLEPFYGWIGPALPKDNPEARSVERSASVGNRESIRTRPDRLAKTTIEPAPLMSDERLASLAGVNSIKPTVDGASWENGPLRGGLLPRRFGAAILTR